MAALGVRCLVPAFDADIVSQLKAQRDGPVYLRLGYEVMPDGENVLSYAPWRCVLPGSQGVLAALGPLAGVAWKALSDLDEATRPAVWAVTELPLEGRAQPPQAFLKAAESDTLYVIEEHAKQGGLGMQISYFLTAHGLQPKRLIHRHALGYPSGRYGSQSFHRKECELDANSLRVLVLQRKTP
jgi:transketolase